MSSKVLIARNREFCTCDFLNKRYNESETVKRLEPKLDNTVYIDEETGGMI